MSETLFSAVRTRFNDRARDQMALGLWFSVLAGVLFLSTAGQSVPITAGLMLQLTGAYSTFVMSGKTERSHFVHIVPSEFALTALADL
jgi:hypothetical protein